MSPMTYRSRRFANLRSAESSGAQHDHLASLHDSLDDLAVARPIARRHIGDTDGLVVTIEQDTVDARIAAEVEVTLHIHDAVHISYNGISTSLVEFPN